MNAAPASAVWMRPWAALEKWGGAKSLVQETDRLRRQYLLEESAARLSGALEAEDFGAARTPLVLLRAEDLLDSGAFVEMRRLLRTLPGGCAPAHLARRWLLEGVGWLREARYDRAAVAFRKGRHLLGDAATQAARLVRMELAVEQAYLLLWLGQAADAARELARLQRAVTAGLKGAAVSAPWLALQGRVCNDRGIAAGHMGDHGAEEVFYRRAAHARRRAGRRFDLAITLNNLTECDIERHRLPSALRHARQVLAIFQDTSQRSLVLAFCHDNLGDIQARLGHLSEAQSHYRRAIEIGARGGYRRIQAEASLGLAGVLLAAGDVDLAENHARSALRHARLDVRTLVTAQRTLAEVLLTQGLENEALQHAQEGQRLAIEHAVGHEDLALLRVAARALQEIGLFGEAENMFRQGLEQARKAANALEEGRLALAFAGFQQALTDRGQTYRRELARYYFQRARDLFEESSAQEDLRACYRSRFSRQYLVPHHLLENIPADLAGHVEDLSVLLELSQGLAAVQGEEALLERTLEGLLARANAAFGCAVLCDEQERVRFVLARPDHKVKDVAALGRLSFLRDAMGWGNPRLFEARSFKDGLGRWLKRNGAAAFIVLPLQAVGSARGLLLLGGTTFNKDRLGLWMGFANQAAMALEAAALYRRASRDTLTGLFSRHFVEVTLEHELNRAQRSGSHTSVLFFDLDHFKQVNDRFGHLVGDEALKSVARALRSQLRHSDIVGRWGGEEFVAVLPDTALDAALAVAEKLRAQIQKGHRAFREGCDLTTSIGVATCLPGDAMELTELVSRADEAVYQAKRAGRNRVCAYTELL